MLSLKKRPVAEPEDPPEDDLHDGEEHQYGGEVDLNAVGKPSKKPFFIMVGAIVLLVFGSIGMAVLKQQPQSASRVVAGARPVNEITLSPQGPPDAEPGAREPDALAAIQSPPPVQSAPADQTAIPVPAASPAPQPGTGPQVNLPALTAGAPPSAAAFPITPAGTSQLPAPMRQPDPVSQPARDETGEKAAEALKEISSRLDQLEKHVSDLSRLETSVRHIEELAEQIRSGMTAAPRPQSKPAPAPAGKPMAEAAPAKPAVPKVKVAVEQRRKPVSPSSKVLVTQRSTDCTLVLVDDGTEEASIRSDGVTRTYRTGEFAPCVGTIRRVEYRDDAFLVSGSRGQLQLRAK